MIYVNLQYFIVPSPVLFFFSYMYSVLKNGTLCGCANDSTILNDTLNDDVCDHRFDLRFITINASVCG